MGEWACPISIRVLMGYYVVPFEAGASRWFRVAFEILIISKNWCGMINAVSSSISEL